MFPKSLFSIVGPGILVAATGVGAGDLATAAFAGSKLGVAVLWAVMLGALIKFFLTEGLTRWQLATGETLLEGSMSRLGRPAQYLFLIYLLLWSFMVAAALMSACGVAAHAIFPIFESAATGKIIYGIALSLIGVVMVRLGGYGLFEKVMSLCIGVMFVTVVVSAFLLAPGWDSVFNGLIWPAIPEGGLTWTIALMGGVGGTVTVLCYGYWIREEGRFGADALSLCRIDLGIGYLMTALFGLAMVIIGSTVQMEGRGATLVIRLAERLGEQLGSVGKWAFLFSALGAVFSSLLGVWQSVPYLFSDLFGKIRSPRGEPQKVSADDPAYRWYLFGIAILPMIGLWVGFAKMQKLYAIVGALFMPMLALVLLMLNSRSKWIGERHRNHPVLSGIFIMILVFFLLAGGMSVQKALG